MRTSPNLEERKLITRSIRGERKAQSQLYQRYVKAMYNTVIRMVPNEMDAEDILQNSFVKVFQKLHTFQGESTLGAWIKRITINTALNFIRRRKRLSFVEIENELEPAVYPDDNSEPPVDMKSIHYAIKQLPGGCRLVFNLFLLEGYQHKEIAEILGITESTSKTQYRRARLLLQEQLKSKLNDY